MDLDGPFEIFTRQILKDMPFIKWKDKEAGEGEG
jgi:hypothetical protein